VDFDLLFVLAHRAIVIRGAALIWLLRELTS
jgi:hypothetical protein